MMTTADLTDLARDYLQTWADPDPARRRTAIDELWAPDGRLVISPIGLVVEGVDAIDAHTSRVHDENIAGRGMAFVYDQHAEAGDAALLRWSMRAPDGTVVGRGVDVVFRDEDGRVRTVYMFMGVD